METRTWTNKEFQREFRTPKNLNEAITLIEEKYSKSNKVVCEITVNGVLLSEKDEENLGSSDFSEIKTLEIKLSNPVDLVIEAKKSTGEYVSRLKQASIEAAEKFRTEDLESAHRLFGSVIDATRWTIEMFNNIRQVESSTHQEKLGQNEWIEIESNFLTLTQEILEAYEKSDFFLVSDLLEYELPNQLDQWMGGV